MFLKDNITSIQLLYYIYINGVTEEKDLLHFDSVAIHCVFVIVCIGLIYIAETSTFLQVLMKCQI